MNIQQLQKYTVFQGMTGPEITEALHALEAYAKCYKKSETLLTAGSVTECRF